jgi:hypothetical protein
MDYVLHVVLEQADGWELISHIGASVAPAPRKEKPEVVTWTRDEVRAFHAVSDQSKPATVSRIALPNGTRRERCSVGAAYPEPWGGWIMARGCAQNGKWPAIHRQPHFSNLRD